MRPRFHSFVALALVARVVIGCETTPFRCRVDTQCAAGAVCTPNGFCAARDTRCPSGLRFTESARNPNTCVAPGTLDDAPTVDATDDLTPTDAPDAADVSDPSDVSDSSDAFDAADASDSSDVFDAADVSDSFDASDAVDVSDVVDAAVDRADVGADPCSAEPVQLVGPLSGTRLHSNRVQLRARSTNTAGSIEYALSQDPTFAVGSSAMAIVARGAIATGTFSSLTRGVYYWRARKRCPGDEPRAGTGWGPVWSVWVGGAGASQSPIGWLSDVNNNGRGDLVFGTPSGGVTDTIEVVLDRAGQPPTRVGTGLTRSAPAYTGFGRSVAIVPDMNGDGRAEIAVGHCDRSDTTCTSAVHLFTVSTAGTIEPLGAPIAPAPTLRFGFSIAGVGDLDGDGFGDLAVGAPDPDYMRAGSVFFVRGGPVPPFTVAMNVLTRIDRSTVPPLTNFGWRVAGPGDVTGDEIPDVVITSFERAWVYPGTGNASLVGAPIALRLTAAEEGTFGFNAVGAGDLNNDGVADFALAAPGASALLGRVGVYYGRVPATLVDAAPNVMLMGTAAAGLFGYAMAGAGDLFGDGPDSLAIGAPGAVSGSVRILRGSGSSTIELIPAAVDRSNVRIGRSLAIVSDTDGDGFDDLAASGILVGDAGSVGNILVGRGGSGGPLLSPWWTRLVGTTSAFGQSLMGR